MLIFKGTHTIRLFWGQGELLFLECLALYSAHGTCSKYRSHLLLFILIIYISRILSQDIHARHHTELYSHSLGHQPVPPGHSPESQVSVLAVPQIRSATLFHINAITPENWKLPFLTILTLYLFLKVGLGTIFSR